MYRTPFYVIIQKSYTVFLTHPVRTSLWSISYKTSCNKAGRQYSTNDTI